ncbi:polysaccharide lyase family protein [Clostridium akagii]|uniref:polysaccharide lyase family protein n=1 Tax=Clostridium akagii TaxID=91623 RepID=UPI00068E7989|nr:polysaccharide lyase family protein [Clostridium akagii]
MKKICGILIVTICAICMITGSYHKKNVVPLLGNNAGVGVVQLTSDVNARTATMSNQYITIKINSDGTVYSLVKNNKELIGTAKGFYASVNGVTGFTANSFKIVTNNSTMVDVAYISDWGELHYVLRNNVSGIYSYFVASNLGTVGEFRTVYRVDGSIFRNGYNSVKSGALPTLSDIQNGTKLQDETWQFQNGQIYTKYDWADYEYRDHVHGLYGNGNGIWLIPVSKEYYSGGPMRQELMVHLESSTGDGVLLNMLKGSHFGAQSVTIPSGKIYGPWLVYVNDGDIADANSQASVEENSWTYSWLNNVNYPISRTSVSGKINVSNGRSAANTMVVLAKPGGEFYTQGSDYIFYSKTDNNGNFNIKNVRPGSYSIYAYSTNGTITDQFEKDNINVSGLTLNLGNLNWNATQYSNFIWQIGTADRLASEFKLGNLPRQYGLPAQVPANLTYTIGQSTPANDWYYAQTKPGNWNVNFTMIKTYTSNAHLTVAVASVSRNPVLNVLVNGKKVSTLDYSTENDQTTYRSANQSGRYRLCDITFPASSLQDGKNTITLQMQKIGTDGGIMYDTLKLEIE